MSRRIVQVRSLARLFVARARIELAVIRFRREMPAVAVYATIWAAEAG